LLQEDNAMAVYPKIQSPCPYKANLAAVMEGDFCRMCRRQVVDLTPMGDAQRIAFLKGCETEVCVSYLAPRRIALAAMAAAAIALPTAAAACDDTTQIIDIVVGGIKDPAHTELIRDVDLSAPELPVVYEAAPAARPAQPTSTAVGPAIMTQAVTEAPATKPAAS
jgi:hypothetical protein